MNELIGSMADPFPMAVAVDVEGIRRSNRYCTGATAGKDGWVHYEDEEVLGKNARLSYKLIGVMPQQVYVLKVLEVTSGSAVFGWLLFVKVEVDTVLDVDDRNRQRMILRSVGMLGLGDRNHPTVEFRGGRVIIGPSESNPKGRIVLMSADGAVTVENP